MHQLFLSLLTVQRHIIFEVFTLYGSLSPDK